MAWKHAGGTGLVGSSTLQHTVSTDMFPACTMYYVSKDVMAYTGTMAYCRNFRPLLESPEFTVEQFPCAFKES